MPNLNLQYVVYLHIGYFTKNNSKIIAKIVGR